MYVKLGKISKESKTGNPIIKNLNGQSFEVTFIAAFVWDRLNGATSLSSIKNEISQVGDISQDKLGESIELILLELEKVGLVTQRENEIPY